MINTEEHKPNLKKLEEEKAINVKEIFSKYIYHWPVFVTAILICFTASIFYLRYTPKVYSVNSTLLIKDDKKTATGVGNDLLNQLDLFGSSKVVDNEIEILKSKTLMRKVIDRLNLVITFRAKGIVVNSDLYLNRPVDITVVQMDSLYYGKTLDLSFVDSSTYLIEDKSTGKKIQGRLNQLQRNVLGVYKIERTPNFDKFSKEQLTITVNDPQILTSKYLELLNVSLASKQSTVLNLSLETTVPKRGQDILNTLIQVYNEAALADKNKTTQSTISFIDERLKLISGELTEVEKSVESFKSSRGLTDISNDANLFLESVKTNDTKLNEVELKISVIKDIQHYINSNSVQEKLPSTLGIDDPVLLSQINQLGELQLKRDQLLATTQPDNPLVEPITKQIETVRAGIKSNIQNIAQSLANTKKALEGNDNQYQGAIKKIPGQERQFISIKRQQSIKETLYLYLLQKKEEAALSYASAVADSRIVDAAFYSDDPIKPKKSIIYLAALLLGILLPIAYLYLKDSLNDKILSSSDIEKITSTPILGEIFYSEGVEPIVVNINSRKAIAEQFRSIRTNMQFLYGKQVSGEGKVMLLTSSMSGEGKSFVASNIAAALAISGKKTVLLELDLRKPKVSKYLELNNKTGLSNYLIGKAEISDIIQPTSINPNLFIIGSGPIPPNPSELLIQNEIKILIEFLRKEFDEILIDTPPIGLVTDAQILGKFADSTLYLVRQGITFKKQIQNLDELYVNNKFPRMNVLLNGIKLGRSAEYGYGYGYGYGYYSDDSGPKKLTFKTIVKDFYKRF